MPGAAKAESEWQAENAKGAEVARRWQQSGRDLVSFRGTRPLSADVEKAERAHEALEAEMKGQGRRALTALNKFDTLVTGSDLEPAERQKLAADYALAQHERAIELWKSLSITLDERDEARNIAGKPGRDWKIGRGAVANRPDGGIAEAAAIIEARLKNFDVAALTNVATA